MKLRGSPVNPSLNGTTVGRWAGVGDGALHTGDGRVPSMVDLALELHLDDLTALVVDVGANDQTLLTALDAMADGNDISRLRKE